MSTITLDIEAVPGTPNWIKSDIAEKLHPPGNIKKPESRDKWFAEKGPEVLKEKYAACGLDAATGEIICIGVKVDDSETRVIIGETEAAIISDFYTVAETVYMDTKIKPVFVGHNIIAFDLPYIWRRALVNGIRPSSLFKPPAALKPWDEHTFDTLVEWAGIRDRISLDKLCKVFGIKGKDGITGADVWPMYQEGKLSEIYEYCGSDVDKTYELYKRMTLS